jgi:hypothetical protein
MTSEEHAWMRRIEDKLDKHSDQLACVNKSIADLTAYGCAQAPRHDDHESRLRIVENSMAESKGKGVVIGAVISGIISVSAVYIGKIFK